MTKKLQSAMVVSVGAMLFGGCLNGYPQDPHAPGAPPEEREAPPPDVWEDEYPDEGTDGFASDYMGDLQISNAHLSGDMGSVHDFGGAASPNTHYQDYGYANITLTTTNESEGYSAMAIIYLQGGIDHPSIVPGASFHFRGGYGSDQGISMSVTGCSGPREGSWEFDAGADDVTLEVEEGSLPGTLRMDFVSTFSGSGSTDGSFEVQVPQS